MKPHRMTWAGLIVLATMSASGCGLVQINGVDWSALFDGRWALTLQGSSTHCIEIADGRVTAEFLQCMTSVPVSDATIIATDLKTVTFGFTQTDTIGGKPTMARLSFIGTVQADGSIAGTVTVFANSGGVNDSDAGAFVMRRSF